MKSIPDPSFSSVMLMHTDAQAAFDRLMRARQETGEFNIGAITALSAAAFREQKLAARPSAKGRAPRHSATRATRKVHE
jgi:hypothetical protein